jgi:succinate dehydrogenase/fumarate reductase flavoprotein subunit
MEVIVVGTGLAGASAAASLGEMGYKVKAFCFQDSPRRAHSIAAQGGINAAKNYQNDGDSVFRLFYDTIKGGDIVRVKRTYIAWPKYLQILLTNVWHKVCHLRVNMVVY